MNFELLKGDMWQISATFSHNTLQCGKHCNYECCNEIAVVGCAISQLISENLSGSEGS